MERVSALEGDLPILILAPHGANDHNTALVAEIIQREMDTYAVINYGWERTIVVDYWKDKANCNNVRHIHEDVIKDEFLDPILTYAKRIVREHNFVFVFTIHGMANYVRTQAGDEGLDVVIGYGEGRPPSYSCEPRLKDAFIYYLGQSGLGTYEGAAGGQYAGKAKDNLNQLFRRWYPNNQVQSMQIEIVRELRDDKEVAELTAKAIASAIDDLLEFDDGTDILITPKSV